MLGATIVFTILVALTLCRPEDASAVSKGIVFGIISIPFGTIAAALASGLTLHYTLINAAPAFVLAALLAAGMIFFQQKTLIIFRAFGNLLQAFIILARSRGVESTLGITVIPGMDPLAEQLETIAMIGITLAGAYPFVHVLSKLRPGSQCDREAHGRQWTFRDRNAGLPGKSAPDVRYDPTHG